jgi:hypothetical protein
MFALQCRVESVGGTDDLYREEETAARREAALFFSRKFRRLGGASRLWKAL